MTRRHLLRRASCGFGLLGLTSLLAADNPLAPSHVDRPSPRREPGDAFTKNREGAPA